MRWTTTTSTKKSKNRTIAPCVRLSLVKKTVLSLSLHTRHGKHRSHTYIRTMKTRLWYLLYFSDLSLTRNIDSHLCVNKHFGTVQVPRLNVSVKLHLLKNQIYYYTCRARGRMVDGRNDGMTRAKKKQRSEQVGLAAIDKAGKKRRDERASFPYWVIRSKSFVYAHFQLLMVGVVVIRIYQLHSILRNAVRQTCTGAL